MRAFAILIALALAAMTAGAQSPTAQRDQALHTIDACLASNEKSNKVCKGVDASIRILTDAYRTGDKSVLPTLLRYTYLGDFYDEAFLAEPEPFLTALGGLAEEQQQGVIARMAGPQFRPLKKAQFELMRTALTGISESSPVAGIAQVCLQELERHNASLWLDYFPPQTFTERSADLHRFWFSRELYSLGQKPLWPASSSTETTYRFTYLGAFSGPRTIIARVLSDGSASVQMSALDEQRHVVVEDTAVTASAEQFAAFAAALQRADFWNMEPDVPTSGMDGAEWILEGVRNGQYHLVVRWCPASSSQPSQDRSFADAAWLLCEFAGLKPHGGC